MSKVRPAPKVYLRREYFLCRRNHRRISTDPPGLGVAATHGDYPNVMFPFASSRSPRWLKHAYNWVTHRFMLLLYCPRVSPVRCARSSASALRGRRGGIARSIPYANAVNDGFRENKVRSQGGGFGSTSAKDPSYKHARNPLCCCGAANGRFRPIKSHSRFPVAVVLVARCGHSGVAYCPSMPFTELRGFQGREIPHCET
jgi:hypothetical protein